jgi:hypothetical protein
MEGNEDHEMDETFRCSICQQKMWYGLYQVNRDMCERCQAEEPH